MSGQQLNQLNSTVEPLLST